MYGTKLVVPSLAHKLAKAARTVKLLRAVFVYD
jgi:hypothetical protein